MRAVGIEATWSSAPSAEDIRSRDQERLVAQLRHVGEPADDDLAVARVLLSDADPEALVASLVHGRRAALPAAEDLVESAPAAAAPEPRERFAKPPPRPGFEDTQWFSINIGRRKNAEPRWLLPLICRRGHLTRSDIGAIRVFDRDTRFEVVRSALGRFEAALAAADDDGVEVARAEPAVAPSHEKAGRPQRGPAIPSRKPQGRKGRRVR